MSWQAGRHRRRASVAAVMEFYPVGERFFQEFTLRQVLLNAAENGSGPSAAGIPSRTEAEYCRACRDEALLLRLAPSGHVIGLDMDAALVLATARGCDLAVLSELLPAAEGGLVEAASADKDRID